MNVNPGGKQPKMRPGWFVRNGLRFKQHMVFEGGPYEGQPKGLRQVCKERFGAEAITGKGSTLNKNLIIVKLQAKAYFENLSKRFLNAPWTFKNNLQLVLFYCNSIC